MGYDTSMTIKKGFFMLIALRFVGVVLLVVSSQLPVSLTCIACGTYVLTRYVRIILRSRAWNLTLNLRMYIEPDVSRHLEYSSIPGIAERQPVSTACLGLPLCGRYRYSSINTSAITLNN